jgi:hypothetical protein
MTRQAPEHSYSQCRSRPSENGWCEPAFPSRTASVRAHLDVRSNALSWAVAHWISDFRQKPYRTVDEGLTRRRSVWKKNISPYGTLGRYRFSGWRTSCLEIRHGGLYGQSSAEMEREVGRVSGPLDSRASRILRRPGYRAVRADPRLRRRQALQLAHADPRARAALAVSVNGESRSGRTSAGPVTPGFARGIPPTRGSSAFARRIAVLNASARSLIGGRSVVGGLVPPRLREPTGRAGETATCCAMSETELR